MHGGVRPVRDRSRLQNLSWQFWGPPVSVASEAQSRCRACAYRPDLKSWTKIASHVQPIAASVTPPSPGIMRASSPIPFRTRCATDRIRSFQCGAAWVVPRLLGRTWRHGQEPKLNSRKPTLTTLTRLNRNAVPSARVSCRKKRKLRDHFGRSEAAVDEFTRIKNTRSFFPELRCAVFRAARPHFARGFEATRMPSPTSGKCTPNPWSFYFLKDGRVRVAACGRDIVCCCRLPILAAGSRLKCTALRSGLDHASPSP